MRLNTVATVIVAAFTALTQGGCSSVGGYTNVGNGRVGGRMDPGGVSVDGSGRNGHGGARVDSQNICLNGGARTAGANFCLDTRTIVDIFRGGNPQPQAEAPQGVPQRAVPPRPQTPTSGY